MVAKYRQHLIEAQNLKPDSKERSATIKEICTGNLELVKRSHGEASLYCVRYMYTFFTATIGEEGDEDSSSESNLKMLAEMTHDGERIKAN